MNRCPDTTLDEGRVGVGAVGHRFQPRTNPNRWFMNAKDIDISTEAVRELYQEPAQ